MLPAPCADYPQQNLFTRMHVRISIVGLVRILISVVGIHVVGHGPSVDHEIHRTIRFGNYGHAPRGHANWTSFSCLILGLLMNQWINLGKLEEVFAVIAARGCVVSRIS